jgi:hypothetical protein
VIKGETHYVCLADWAKVPSAFQSNPSAGTSTESDVEQQHPTAAGLDEFSSDEDSQRRTAAEVDDEFFSSDEDSGSDLDISFLVKTAVVDEEREIICISPGPPAERKLPAIRTVDIGLEDMAKRYELQGYGLPTTKAAISADGMLSDEVVGLFLNTVVVRAKLCTTFNIVTVFFFKYCYIIMAGTHTNSTADNITGSTSVSPHRHKP